MRLSLNGSLYRFLKEIRLLRGRKTKIQETNMPDGLRGIVCRRLVNRFVTFSLRQIVFVTRQSRTMSFRKTVSMTFFPSVLDDIFIRVHAGGTMVKKDRFESFTALPACTRHASHGAVAFSLTASAGR